MLPLSVLQSAAITVGQSDSLSDQEAMVLIGIGFLIGIVLLYYGFKLWRIKRLVEDTPTEKVRSMAVGRTELNGTARDDGITYEAPFSEHEHCLYTDWKIEEYKRQPNHDDDHGDDYDWETVASGTDVAPFWLEDDTGQVRVKAHQEDPKYEISDEFSMRTTVAGEPPDPIYDTITNGRRMPERDVEDDGEEDEGFVSNAVDTVKDAFDNAEGQVGTSNNKRRYKQEILPVDSDVYVLGGAQPLPVEEAGVENESKLAIEADGGTGLLLISDMAEDQLTKHYSRKGPLLLLAGILVSAASFYGLLRFLGI